MTRPGIAFITTVVVIEHKDAQDDGSSQQARGEELPDDSKTLKRQKILKENITAEATFINGSLLESSLHVTIVTSILLMCRDEKLCDTSRR